VVQKSPRETIAELQGLVVPYFKQETLEPLKGLRRYVAFGLLGAMLLGMGVVFLAMAGLRALQSETGSRFTGSWTWAPYGIMVLGLLLGAAATWKARTRRGAER